MSATAIADVIRRYRFRFAHEDQLQAGLAAVLAKAGMAVEREVRLDGCGRIDLLVDRVGIEVKVAGATAGVVRQLRRYAASDRIGGLVLVTSRARHLNVPSEIAGKPVELVTLLGGGL